MSVSSWRSTVPVGGDTVEQRLAQILRELGMREQTIGYQCALLTVCLYRGDRRCQHHQDHLS